MASFSIFLTTNHRFLATKTTSPKTRSPGAFHHLERVQKKLMLVEMERARCSRDPRGQEPWHVHQRRSQRYRKGTTSGWVEHHNHHISPTSSYRLYRIHLYNQYNVYTTITYNNYHLLLHLQLFSKVLWSVSSVVLWQHPEADIGSGLAILAIVALSCRTTS